MKQLVGVFLGAKDIGVEQRELPEIVADGVLIKVSACGICGTDMHNYNGHGFFSPGMVPGHEFSGRVEKLGQGVAGLVIGTRVVVNPMHSLVGLGGVPGAFAQYVMVPAALVGTSIYPIPDSISDEEGALLEPFAVALHAVNRADPAPDAKTVVFGAGTIGLCTVLALQDRGIKDIVVTDISPARLALAESFGVKTFNVSMGPVLDYLRSVYGETPVPFSPQPSPAVDLTIDCAGLDQTYLDCFQVTRFGGKIIIVARPRGGFVFDPAPILLRELTVFGSWSYVDEFQQAIDLLKAGKVDLRPLITHRYGLADLADAFRKQSDIFEAVKVMVEIPA